MNTKSKKDFLATAVQTTEVRAPKLNLLQTAVLACAIREADGTAAKKAVKLGTYEGAMTIRVGYKLAKGEDSTTAPTCNLLTLSVLCKAIRLSGIQQDNFFATLRNVALEAFNGGELVGDAMSDEDKKIAQAIERLRAEVISKLPRKPLSGQCRLKECQITVLETEESLM